MDKQILKEQVAITDSEKAWGYSTLELTEAAKGMRVTIEKINHTLTTTDCSKDTVIFTVRKSRGEFNV